MKYVKLLFSLLIVVLLAVSISGCSESGSSGGTSTTKRTVTLIDDVAVVKPLDYEAYRFYLDFPANIEINLDFREGQDINLYIMEEKEYEVWTNGGKAEAYVIRKKIGSGTFTDQLPTGTYILVLDNRYSLVTSKTIEIKVVAKEI
ncbi:hypothetical protein [Thermococcus sp.]